MNIDETKKEAALLNFSNVRRVSVFLPAFCSKNFSLPLG